MQGLIGQPCGYWWPGASAPGHQYPQCWVGTHAFPDVYGLTKKPTNRKSHFFFNELVSMTCSQIACAWWCHNMKYFSSLLAPLWEESNSWFHSQMASNSKLWFFPFVSQNKLLQKKKQWCGFATIRFVYHDTWLTTWFICPCYSLTAT